MLRSSRESTFRRKLEGRAPAPTSFHPFHFRFRRLAYPVAAFWAAGSSVNMAGTLGLLVAGRVRAVVARCGFATRGVAGPGSISREPDPDSDWEPEERELQEVERYQVLSGPSA